MDARQALHDRIDHDFRLHPPQTKLTAARLDRLRSRARALAHEFVDVCEPGRELSMALTDLENALQHAIAAVVRYQDEPAEAAGD